MLFKAGKSTLDSHREMIYALTRQINAQQVMMARLSRAFLDVTKAKTAEEMMTFVPRLREVLAEIATAGGE